MGEFHDAVTKLLGAFSCGLSMIKAQGRKNEKAPVVDVSSKKAEGHLSKSLKKNRLEVENAYGEDLIRCGPRFAEGDAEAHSSLSRILFRLNTIIKRFTTGKQRSTDYQALLNLSNASRIEAINTFEQLSQRITRSSLALVPVSPGLTPPDRHHRQRRKKSSSNASSKHTRSKSAPETLISPQGWVRPKAARRQTGEYTKSSKSSRSNTRQASPKPQSTALTIVPPRHMSASGPARIIDASIDEGNTQATPPPNYTAFPIELLHASRRTKNRKSIMSFATDSTKLGEIPERKWARNQTGDYPLTTYYPLEPYQEPEKQRSRLMKLFRR